MPPKKKKEEPSKKALQKKKEKLLEDKTFGLKNKNKSKVVQKQIQAAEKSIMGGPNAERQRQLEEAKKEAKAQAKAMRKAAEAERNALFGEALAAVQKKTTVKTKAASDAKGRDADDDDEKKGTSRAMKMMYQMDAKEAAEKLKEDPNYVPTLEDEIEEQRQAMFAALQKNGKKGTPVTEASFRAWQEGKRREKAEQAKKLVEAELRKKKGGKGLSVLSGRDLYEYKRDLFVDDEEGAPVEEEEWLRRVSEEEEEEEAADAQQDDTDPLEKPPPTPEMLAQLRSADENDAPSPPDRGTVNGNSDCQSAAASMENNLGADDER